MTTIEYRSLGIEEVFDAVEIVLVRDINAALEEVYTRRAESDRQRALRREIDYEPLTWDPVTPNHFFTGNFPSLVLEEVSVETYPYIVLTIDDSTPDIENEQHDELDVSRKILVIHSLAAANPEQGAEVVFRRAVRMAEAAFLALVSDNSMHSRLYGISNPVRAQPSLPWVYRKEGHGDNWWFQAVAIGLGIKSYTSLYE